MAGMLIRWTDSRVLRAEVDLKAGPCGGVRLGELARCSHPVL